MVFGNIVDPNNWNKSVRGLVHDVRIPSPALAADNLPLDDPGRLERPDRLLEPLVLGLFVALDSGVADEARELDERSHDNGGEDKLRLLTLFCDLRRAMAGGIPGSGVTPSDISVLRPKVLRFADTDGNRGMGSRINSGNESNASGSLALGGLRTASWLCKRPASECCARCSTNACRCKGLVQYSSGRKMALTFS